MTLSEGEPRGGGLVGAAAAFRDLLPAGAVMAIDAVHDRTDTLFPCELAQIERAVAKRRHEFSTGRWLARRVLNDLGHAAVALPADESRRPRWPQDVVGSITHAAGVCAVMVAPRRRIAALGIDMEEISRVTDDLLPAISHEDERGALSWSVPARLMPALAFSAREAVFKAYNPATDHFLGFKDVMLTVAEDRFAAHIIDAKAPPFFGRNRITGRSCTAGDLIVSVVAQPA